jgi:hypothetical protein
MFIRNLKTKRLCSGSASAAVPQPTASPSSCATSFPMHHQRRIPRLGPEPLFAFRMMPYHGTAVSTHPLARLLATATTCCRGRSTTAATGDPCISPTSQRNSTPPRDIPFVHSLWCSYPYERALALVARCGAVKGTRVRTLGHSLQGREISCVTSCPSSRIYLHLHLHLHLHLLILLPSDDVTAPLQLHHVRHWPPGCLGHSQVRVPPHKQPRFSTASTAFLLILLLLQAAPRRNPRLILLRRPAAAPSRRRQRLQRRCSRRPRHASPAAIHAQHRPPHVPRRRCNGPSAHQRVRR